MLSLLYYWDKLYSWILLGSILLRIFASLHGGILVCTVFSFFDNNYITFGIRNAGLIK